jgi:hypothetical protein
MMDRLGIALATTLPLAMTTLTSAQGGDDPDHCTPIVLGEVVQGTTDGYTDVSDEVCPYTGSTSPDVYYCYAPTADHHLTVSLCESDYDTKVYVYDADLELIVNALGETSCNDDACSSAMGGQFRSLLTCVPVEAGATYYVVVDGWNGASGAYTLELDVTTPDELCLPDEPCAPLECPPDGVDEGETCVPGAPDDFNGGCDAPSGAAFSPIACGTTVCGETWLTPGTRDGDWYSVTTAARSSLSWAVIAEFDMIIARADNGGVDDCAAAGGFAELLIAADPCDLRAIDPPPLDPGTYWFYVAPNFTGAIACGADGGRYLATLSCVDEDPPCPSDLDGDGATAFGDLLLLLLGWGPCPPDCPGDLDGDEAVAFGDLLLLLLAWGPCPG